MLKHNLCARISANVLWHIRHSKVLDGLFWIGIFELIQTIATLLVYMIEPHSPYMTVLDVCTNHSQYVVSSNFLIDWLAFNRILITFIFTLAIIALCLGAICLICYLFYHYIIHPSYRRYKINVHDAYEQKKLSHNN